ncbi:hypothetical protein XcyCFBP4188_22115, partial [Xanthomonas hortorum pv. cynarae]
QQGGLGLVMTTLIVTAPPMAAAFFQGTLGQFTAYSALGQLDRANQEPGAGRPYQPSEPAKERNDSGADHGRRNTVMRTEPAPSQEPAAGSRGIATK